MPQTRSFSTPLLSVAAAAALVLSTAVLGQGATAEPGIAVRGTSSAINPEGTSVTVAKPPGVAPGDVLVARVANRGNVQAALSGDGWKAVGATSSAVMLKSVVLTRVATGDEPSSYVFDVSARSPLVASITAFDGVDAFDPVDVFSGKVNGFSDTFRTAPVTPGVGNAVAVWFGTQLFSGADCEDSRIDQPSGFAEILDRCLPRQDGLVMDTAHRQLGAGGVHAVWTGASGQERTNVVQAITLRPAAKVQAPNRFAGSSVSVGQLWDGLDEDGQRNTALPNARLHEPSGLAASRVNPDVQYVHSESNVHGMVAVSTRNAQVLGRYDVAIPQQWDWEDIATGPCPAGSCVYAGDIGRVNGKPNPPSTFAVYRVAEPDLAAGETSGRLTGDWFRFRYPDGAHNAEALMVHPVTGKIYVITKDADQADVYTFPSPLPAPSATTVTTLTKVATLQRPPWDGQGNQGRYAEVTAASIHPGANRILVRTPYMVWEYRGTPGGSFDSALDAAPVALTAPAHEGQGESVEYAADGSAYYTLGEREVPPFTLRRVDRR